MKKENQKYVIIGVLAVVAVIVIILAYSSKNKINPVQAVNTITLPASAYIQQDNGTAQIFAPDQPGVGSLTQQQATDLGLYTPEMTAFMNG